MSRNNVYEYNAVFGPKTRGGIVTRDAGDQNGPVTGTIFPQQLDPAEQRRVRGLRLLRRLHQPDAEADAERHPGRDEGRVRRHRLGLRTDHNVFYGGQRQFTPGTTDKVADPKFTSATNLILQAGSPAIGLGTTKYADIDVDGNAVGTRVDAGAYQFTP